MSLRYLELEIRALALSVASCAALGCTDPLPPPPPPPPPPSPAPVASVEVTGPSRIVLGATTTLGLVVRDAAGNDLSDRTVTWSSSAEEVATVTQEGHLAANGRGVATITASSEGVSGGLEVLVGVPFEQVAVGPDFTCALDDLGAALCWGNNDKGQLGIGALGGSLGEPALVGGSRLFDGLSAESGRACAVTETNGYCWGTGYFGTPAPPGDLYATETYLVPTLLQSPEPLVQVSLGPSWGCGVTAAPETICWGNNNWAQLGNYVGGRQPSQVVAGSSGLVEAHAGEAHVCGIRMADQRVLCWGDGSHGQRGDADPRLAQATPVEVSGGLSAVRLSVGAYHSCLIDLDHELYCWGDGANGKLGLGSTESRPVPTRVPGLYREVSAAWESTCAIDLESHAWCWGYNSAGSLGDGSRTDRLVPTPVAGGLEFRRIAAGFHSCGVTRDEELYCWGFNLMGQVGDRTTENRLTPTRVEWPR